MPRRLENLVPNTFGASQCHVSATASDETGNIFPIIDPDGKERVGYMSAMQPSWYCNTQKVKCQLEIRILQGIRCRIPRSPLLPRRILRSLVLLPLAVAAIAAIALAKEPTADRNLSSLLLPGPQPDRSVLLPNQWSLRPAGTNVEVGNFPVNLALCPRGAWVAVLHSGYGPNEAVIVDLKTARVASRVTLPKTFYGLCFSSDGKKLFVSGGEDNVVYQFRFADGKLSDRQTIKLPDRTTAQVTAGLAISPDDKWLYAACCLSSRLAVLPLAAEEKKPPIALAEGSYPYAVLPAAKDGRIFVSLWGKSSVAMVDRAASKIVATWPTASHPQKWSSRPTKIFSTWPVPTATA